MSRDFDRRLERMLDDMFASEDALASLRRDAARHGAGTIGVELAGADLAPGLQAFARKVSNEPYKVIDEDIYALREAGLDTPEIFDLTVGTAVGACLARLRLARALINGERP